MDIEDIKFFPFNSEIDPSTGVDDRLYDAEDLAEYYELFNTPGVFSQPSSGFQVVPASGGLAVILQAGAAFAKGHSCKLKSPVTIPLETANASMPRRDVVVIRLDEVNRTFLPVYIAGTPSIEPQPPELVRNDDIWDLRVCVIHVGANAQTIRSQDITDTRLDGNVCGFVTGAIESVDTTTLFEQYQDFQNLMIANWTADKDAFTTNAEAQLTNQQNEFSGAQNDRQNVWQVWFDSIMIDIERYAAFNFDNIMALPGVTFMLTFADGRIDETLTTTQGGAAVAERQTAFNEDGSINYFEILYSSDGSTLRSTTFKQTFGADGSISGVVT